MINLSNRNAILIGLLFVSLLILPYVLLGENAFITIHDFLDSNPVHVKTIISLGLVGNPDGMIPVLDGVSSLNYVSLIPFDLQTILYILLPLYWAIVCNILFVRLMAFLGMYILCYDYILKGNSLYSFFIAILFCLIPFYADYRLSSAGVPLFLYCVLNLENKRKLFLSYVLLIFFACNSSLTLVGLFICLLWFGWIVYKFFVERLVPKHHILGITLMALVYLTTNITIIYNYFFPSGVISHRVEFGNTSSINDVFSEVFDYLLFSQYHAGSFFSGSVVIVTFILYYLFGRNDKQLKYYYGLYLFVIVLMFLGASSRYLPVTITKSFQFERFYFLYPSFCFVLLAKAFSLIPQKTILVVMISVPLSIGNAFCDKELLINAASIVRGKSSKVPSYNQYFAENLFTEIKKDLHIDKDFNCKVVSVGMYPSVAEYNNFYTLDSYVFNYSLDYKHKFRSVIEKELDKDEKIRSYFDNWGSRCYLFSSELGRKMIYGKRDNTRINHLDINTNALKELGCQYILSAVEIRNFKELGLSYVDSYTTPESYWNIRVYKLI